MTASGALPVELDELSAPFWEAVQERRLLLPRCDACGRRFFAPQLACPSCLSRAWSWIEASGGGAIDTYTIVHRSPLPHLEAPFVLAVVRLDEGPHMLCNVDAGSVDDARSLRAGRRVRADYREVAEGIVFPVFRPDGPDRAA